MAMLKRVSGLGSLSEAIKLNYSLLNIEFVLYERV